jgi:murein L,D-transpeptidase YcbB/YkuD
MQQVRKAVSAAFVLAFATLSFAGAKPPRGTEPPIRLAINIPASRLDVFEFGQLTRSYNVSAGARGANQTPPGNYRIQRIVWNPWWHPPKSKWAIGRKIAPPGPENPMGRVKLQFAELLYIHGTMEESRLGATASHGCVRMSNRDLIELTRLIHQYATPDVHGELIAKLEDQTSLTRNFDLRRAVPLTVSYNLAEIRNGELTIHPDVYRSKKGTRTIKQQILALLKKEGFDVTALSDSRLDEVSRVRNATRLTVPLNSLVAGSGTLER